jgi:hypothetical protein
MAAWSTITVLSFAPGPATTFDAKKSSAPENTAELFATLFSSSIVLSKENTTLDPRRSVTPPIFTVVVNVSAILTALDAGETDTSTCPHANPRNSIVMVSRAMALKTDFVFIANPLRDGCDIENIF